MPTPTGGPRLNGGFDYDVVPPPTIEPDPVDPPTSYESLGVSCKACKAQIMHGEDYAICTRCEERGEGKGAFCQKHKGRVKEFGYQRLCAPCRRYVEKKRAS